MSEAKVSRDLQAQKHFYAEERVEHLNSTLEIPIYVDGQLLETLKMDAYVKLQIAPAFTNAAGYRQFDFQVLEWEVHGFSQALQQDVIFALSDTTQPRSIGLAMTKEADFPATVIYNAIYDVYMNKERIATNLTGLGVAMEVAQLPPSTPVHFQKAFQYGPVQTVAAVCAADRVIDPDNFRAEADRIRSLRG